MQPVPIFDNLGAAVGWYSGSPLHAIHTLSGKRVAFVAADRIFGLGAEYRGAFLKGHFCDELGKPVAFIERASGGPALPALTPPLETPSGFDGLPVPADLPRSLPEQPELQPGWSSKSWCDFLALPTHGCGEAEEPLP
jgi:hypothetical protein